MSMNMSMDMPLPYAVGFGRLRMQRPLGAGCRTKLAGCASMALPNASPLGQFATTSMELILLPAQRKQVGGTEMALISRRRTG